MVAPDQDSGHGAEIDSMPIHLPEVVGQTIEPFDFRRTDVHATVLGLMPWLVEQARFGALHHAESHRGFWVGAATVAVDTSEENPRIGTFTAANFKAKIPEELRDEIDVPDIPKLCAEMDTIERITQEAMSRVVVMVIAGTSNRKRIEQVTGVPSATLHPCEECAQVCNCATQVDENTVIMTVGTGADVMQVQSMREYNERYARFRSTGVFHDAGSYRYSPYSWQFKQTRYLAEVARQGLMGNIYDGKEDAERARRRLFLATMQHL